MASAARAGTSDRTLGMGEERIEWEVAGADERVDHDPLFGTTEFLEFQDDKMRIVRSQDVSPILDTAKFLANDEEYTRTGIKRDEWHYARIPNVIMEEMKATHHADWNDKEDKGHKKFFSVLNTHYPAFKTTAWNHE